MVENWMSLTEYSELTRLDVSSIDDLISREKLETKVINGVTLVNPSTNIHAIAPLEMQELRNSDSIMVAPQFVEKTIGTIINLHEKVIDAKDETIESVKNENAFLKEGLESLQELYAEDRKTIDTLTEQLRLSQEEVEFLRRKYKLMWGKVVEEYSK